MELKEGTDNALLTSSGLIGACRINMNSRNIIGDSFHSHAQA